MIFKNAVVWLGGGTGVAVGCGSGVAGGVAVVWQWCGSDTWFGDILHGKMA